MHSPAARALLQPRALLHHPRDTLKDLTLAGHVITITYWSISSSNSSFQEAGDEGETGGQGKRGRGCLEDITIKSLQPISHHVPA